MIPFERHFIPATLLGLIRRGHPYDFVETYRLTQALYGYRAAYVNLGLWTEGALTDEAGRKLAYRVADELHLVKGDYLIDVGSGLGQAAVDLAVRVENLTALVTGALSDIVDARRKAGVAEFEALPWRNRWATLRMHRAMVHSVKTDTIRYALISAGKP